MATVPGTPSNFTTKGVVALTPIKFLNTVLGQESVLGSVWDVLSSMVTAEGPDYKINQVPRNSVAMKLDTGLQGKIPSQIKVAFHRPYQECPREGTTNEMLGYEEDSRWKYMHLYYNEIKKSFKFFGWGKFANEHDYYNGLKRVSPDIINWWAEYHDKRVQEAILMRYERALTENDTNLLQQFNPNWFIPNTAVCGQPAYDKHDLTHEDGECPCGDTFSGHWVETIGDALFAATNSGANPEYCRMLVEGLIALDWYAANTIKMPLINVGGEMCRLYVCPSDMAAVLVNPFLDGTLGAIHKSGLPKELQMKFPGIIGKVRNLLVNENMRYPTITLGGSDGAWTLTPNFVYPGNNDCRNLDCFSNTSGDLNYVFNIGYVLGPNAYVEWIANPLEYTLKETTEYQKIVGQGSRTCAGIQLAVYDNDTKTDTSWYHNASIIVPTSAQNIVTVL